MRLLVAEDNRDLAQTLKVLLEHSGYTVDVAADGVEALEFLTAAEYDAAILDVMMPRKDGMTLLRELRAQGSRLPVMMLTAKGTTADRIEGFDSGADDYLPKPFSAKELLSRVKAILRRREDYAPSVITVGGLTFDYEAATASYQGRTVSLRRQERQILELLMRNPGHAFTAERIYERVWGWDAQAEINVVWVHMSNLRKRLAELDCPAGIKTVRGLGYVFAEDAR